MATHLVNIGDTFDTRPLANGSSVEEIIPLPGGGYALIAGTVTGSAQPGTPPTREMSLVTVRADGTLAGSPVKLGNVDIEGGKALADGSLLVSVKSADETKISLATLSKSGSLNPFYTTSISALNKNSPFVQTENDVAFGQDGSIALARIASDKAGLFRAVDVLDAKHKLVATVAVDRNVASDNVGSTEVTALKDGRYLVTWAQPAKNGGDVMAQIVTKTGQLAGPAFVAAHVDDLGTTAPTLIRYDVTATANGGFGIGFQGQEVVTSPSFRMEESDIAGAVWSPNKNGTFSQKTVDLKALNGLSDPYLVGLTALASGQFLAVVSNGTQAGAFPNIQQETLLRGYLLGADGTYTGDSLDFFSLASPLSMSVSGEFVTSSSDGRFTIGFSLQDMAADPGNPYGGLHYGFQTYGLSSAGFVTVKGASSKADVLKGNAKADIAEILDGAGGHDRLYGFGGNDRLFGGAGDDLLDGGKGGDRMEGGAGNDTYVVDHFGDLVVEGAGSDVDTVQSTISYALSANLENLILTGKAAIDGTGNGKANQITGNGAANVLDGQGGADVMRGGAGNDTYKVDNLGDRVLEAAGQGTDTIVTSVSLQLADDQSIEILSAEAAIFSFSQIDLTGNALANTLIGNASSNVLNGKGGADILTGGSGFGGDTFVFDTALGKGNVDRITDFGIGDKIQLENAIFKGLANGTLNVGAFKNTALGAVDADDRILYDAKTGALSYDADGNGAAKAVQFAVLGEVGAKVHPTLAATDFFIV